MTADAGWNPNMIVPPGTKVVVRAEVVGEGGAVRHPAGAVGVVVKSPLDVTHSYRVRFLDGYETGLRRAEFSVLKLMQRDAFDGVGAAADSGHDQAAYLEHVIYRCVIGSRAYGLDHEESDVDRRGIFLPPAEWHWSLYGVPEQIEVTREGIPADVGARTDSRTSVVESQECHWEIQKFVTLALKANPNILECLYTPLVEHASPLARDLLVMREAFLSKLIYQTYNGYVASQFRKLEADLRARGAINWKHAMHLIRLLLSGVTALREGHIPVRVEQHREELLAIRGGERAWEDVDRWRLELHREFDEALAGTKLAERPDYEKANGFLVRARRSVI